ncbi:MAG: YncE family protein [Actinomycetota bacterium]
MSIRGLIAVLAVALAACTGQGGSSSIPPQDRLLVGTTSGVLSLDPTTGSVLSESPGVPGLGNWSAVYTATLSEGATVLKGREAATGDVTSSLSLPGDLGIRVVAFDGSMVALMPPLSQGASPWIPEPRTRTTIVVADPSGTGDPDTYDLGGNFEPEAFSPDGESLYMLTYLPAAAPEAYRVVRLDLFDGTVQPVFTNSKSIVETMSGTRLEQVTTSDGSMVHTLYTTQPPAELTDVRASHAAHSGHSTQPVAFVHVLDAENGWAHCVALPRAFWGGDATAEAMAPSPNGRHLYVVDADRDLVAVMDTRKMQVVQEATVDFGTGDGDVRATVSSDGASLYVARGPQITRLDTATLQPVDRWTTEGPVSGLGVGPNGLYVAQPEQVELIDPATGSEIDSIPSPGIEGQLEYLGTPGQ